MKTKIYANYGVLNHEKETYYTDGCPASTAACSDCITVILPDSIVCGKNGLGETLVKPEDSRYTYTLHETLGTFGGMPVLQYINDNGRERRITLNIAE